MNKEFFKRDSSLYIFLILTTIAGWFIHQSDRELSKKYNPYVILFVETVIVLTTVSIIICYNFSRDVDTLLQHARKISYRDYAIFILFGIYGTFTSIFAIHLLKHHDVAKIRISDLMISIPIGAVGTYFLLEDEFTKEKIAGLVLIAVGGLLFAK